MIPIYNSKGQLLMSISRMDLINPKEERTVRKLIQQGVPGSEDILLLDTNFNQIQKENVTDVEPVLGIILPPDTQSINMEPLKFFIRKTDKKGAIIRANPFITISKLGKMVEYAFNIPTKYQVLFFRGEYLQDYYVTLIGLEVSKDSVVHVIDSRLVSTDPDKQIHLELEGAKYPSTVETVTVRSGITLRYFKEVASGKMGIPSEFVIIAYTSRILYGDALTLNEFQVVENSLVKILDDRQAIVYRIENKGYAVDMHRALHRKTSRDSFKSVPKPYIKRTDSVEWIDYRNPSSSKSIIENVQDSYISEEKKSQFSRTQYFKNMMPLNISTSKSYILPNEKIEIHEHSAPTNPSSDPTEMDVSNPATKVIKAYSMKFCTITISDIDANNYKYRMSEIDTIKDIKYRIEADNPEFIAELLNLFVDGKVLYDDEVIQDLQTEGYLSLFVMNK